MISFKRFVPIVLLASAAHAQPTDDTTARIDAVFAKYRDTPGCAVGVARAGAPNLTRAYGLANLDYDIPLAPDSIFEAGSVSKQFTAAAVALLALDGKLSLDDPVRNYLPELPAAASDVTIREMLNHTSGFRDWGTVASLSGWPRGKRAHTMPVILDIMSRQQSLNFPAGTQWSYSNSNYNLAAIIVERVSGKSFPLFTRERIFEPLGMTHSSWRDDYSRVVKRRATGYDANRDGTFSISMHSENIYGNCCLMTTVSDLLLWNENFRSGRVGGRALADLMQTPGVLATGDKIDYALGLFVGTYRGKREVSHSGATAGFRAFLTRLPDDDLSIAVLCNRSDANASSFAHRVADVFLGPAAETKTASIADPDLPSRAGLYRDPQTDAVFPLQVKDNALKFGFDRTVDLTYQGNGRYQLFGDSYIQFDQEGFTLHTGHKPPARYVRVTPATPADLAQYAGTYSSDEVGATYRLSVVDGKLTAHVAPGQEIALIPTYADAFRDEDFDLVHFTRGANGAINGFDIAADFSPSEGTGRVARMHFTVLKTPQ